MSKNKKVNWVATLIVSILIGNLGIDRMMMGQWWLGFLKMFTFGGLGVWWLIDVILIATKYDFKGVKWVK